MDQVEVKLECLKLAVTRAAIERPDRYLERVAEIQTGFYNLVSGHPDPVPESEPGKGSRRAKADKAAPIFE